jgi:hypothetical protein
MIMQDQSEDHDVIHVEENMYRHVLQLCRHLHKYVSIHHML